MSQMAKLKTFIYVYVHAREQEARFSLLTLIVGSNINSNLG